MSYAELNLIFILPAVIALVSLRWLVRWRKLCFTAAAMLLITAVFDNFIVGSGIVAYNPQALSGAFIGFAPIEDFAYTIVAVILIPLSWWWLESKEAERNKK